jgi:hypothetical protein
MLPWPNLFAANGSPAARQGRSAQNILTSGANFNKMWAIIF